MAGPWRLIFCANSFLSPHEEPGARPSKRCRNVRTAPALDAGLTGTTLHDPHHSIGRGLLQGWTFDIDNSGQRAQERATRPQGGDVILSAAGRLSVTRNHATVWIIEYWVREFHHDADTEAHEKQPRVLWENSDNHALYSKTRDLTPILLLSKINRTQYSCLTQIPQRFFPKGTNFHKLGHGKIIPIEKLLNRPRKCLNYRTPYEVFRETRGALHVWMWKLSELPRPKGGASVNQKILPPLRYGLPFIPVQNTGFSGSGNNQTRIHRDFGPYTNVDYISCHRKYWRNN